MKKKLLIWSAVVVLLLAGGVVTVFKSSVLADAVAPPYPGYNPSLYQNTPITISSPSMMGSQTIIYPAKDTSTPPFIAITPGINLPGTTPTVNPLPSITNPPNLTLTNPTQTTTTAMSPNPQMMQCYKENQDYQNSLNAIALDLSTKTRTNLEDVWSRATTKANTDYTAYLNNPNKGLNYMTGMPAEEIAKMYLKSAFEYYLRDPEGLLSKFPTWIKKAAGVNGYGEKCGQPLPTGYANGISFDKSVKIGGITLSLTERTGPFTISVSKTQPISFFSNMMNQFSLKNQICTTGQSSLNYSVSYVKTSGNTSISANFVGSDGNQMLSAGLCSAF